MAICIQGLGVRISTTSISTLVESSDPLICLANAINWETLAEIAMSDLKSTPQGFWRLGPKLHLRVHLSVMVLQTLLKATDRGIEVQVSRAPLYQAFCGKGIFANWKCPDHTKVEEFRNRLSPVTHKKIGDYIVKLAVDLGFARPSIVDIDSTVQEANMAYPADAALMQKLSKKCAKVLDFFKATREKPLPDGLSVDIKAIAKKAKQYFFLAKNAAMEKRRALFKDYHALVCREISPVIELFTQYDATTISRLPWNIKMAIGQIKNQAHQYLQDVAHFIKTHTIKKEKLLAFHCSMVACIKKGKVGKDKEFGRVFQLGRIAGNFIVAYSATSVRMNDKTSLIAAISEHEAIFGKGVLQSVSTDKGYYSAKNVQAVKALGICADGIQRPMSIKNAPPQESVVRLHNRRAGVEPLIGHVKEFGLRRSKMKSDTATLAQGYRSVLGFNLHQLTRKFSKTA